MTAPAPPPSSRTLTFLLDGDVVRLPDPTPTMTVLDYLRDTAGRCGTKEGCAEGDCGACTVVLGEFDGPDRPIRYEAINACIRFLPTLDGKALLTVESLQAPDGPLHPVQQALVDCHGSQCGFCTPGFVMSLFALYQSCEATDRASVLNALSGNLCRCTGYRPILDAALRMFDYPTPQRWSRADAQSSARHQQLEQIQRTEALRGNGFHAPLSVDELAERYAAEPNALLLAGGTDIGLWVTKQLRDLPPLLWLGEAKALQQMVCQDDQLIIGAGVTLSRAWPQIVAHYPTLAEQAERFASLPIRNSATLCGNLANGSPIGDALPVMLALDALLELRHDTATRYLPIDQFYLDYRRTALQPGEFIAAVHLPLPSAGEHLASYKVAKRFDQDISAVSATFLVLLEHHRVREVRLAFGGMAATARRASAAEAALRDQPWTLASIEAAQAALQQDFTPLSDLRASNAYRLQVATNLLLRFYLQTQGEDVSLPADPASIQGA